MESSNKPPKEKTSITVEDVKEIYELTKLIPDLATHTFTTDMAASENSFVAQFMMDLVMAGNFTGIICRKLLCRLFDEARKLKSDCSSPEKYYLLCKEAGYARDEEYMTTMAMFHAYLYSVQNVNNLFALATPKVLRHIHECLAYIKKPWCPSELSDDEVTHPKPGEFRKKATYHTARNFLTGENVTRCELSSEQVEKAMEQLAADFHWALQQALEEKESSQILYTKMIINVRPYSLLISQINRI